MGKTKVLIVGAGPVGLSAALFLSHNEQVEVDIIDSQTAAKNILESKALSVNSRTLHILSGTKTQKQILDLGIKVTKFKMGTGSKDLVENDLSDRLKEKTHFPFFKIYPQHGTEHLLEKEIVERGISVRRGVQFERIVKNQPNNVVVQLSDSSEPKTYNIVLGADGARSKVRKSLGIAFPGETLKQKLYVADFVEDGAQRDYAQIILANPELFIVFPVIDDIVRVVSNFPDFEGYASKVLKLKLTKKVWQSEFQLNNRHVEKMNEGSVYLAGDAAHVHAPIGGRGMNLGIEDVFIFSHLLKDGKLNQYNSIRLPVIRDFVERIKRASVMLEYKKSLLKSVVPYLGPVANYFLKDQMMQFMCGLDHDIPYLPKL